jgi:hypothetical protein
VTEERGDDVPLREDALEDVIKEEATLTAEALERDVTDDEREEMLLQVIKHESRSCVQPGARVHVLSALQQ